MDYDLFVALLSLLLVGIPFFLVCRLLWNIGSYFKRKDK